MTRRVQGPLALSTGKKESRSHGHEKFLLASLAGGITFFVSGYAIYGVLLHDFMVASSTAGVIKGTPDFVPLILSQLIFGAFLTMVLRRWPGAGTLAQGAKAGASLGVLLGLGFSLVQYATMNVMNVALIPGEAVVGAIRGALAGGAIGVVLGRR